jgi:hypothetical protein
MSSAKWGLRRDRNAYKISGDAATNQIPDFVARSFSLQRNQQIPEAQQLPTVVCPTHRCKPDKSKWKTGRKDSSIIVYS